MHDGSMNTLEEVIDYYDKGAVPNAHLDPDIKPLKFTSGEKKDLIAFLRSLNGDLSQFARTAESSVTLSPARFTIAFLLAAAFGFTAEGWISAKVHGPYAAEPEKKVSGEPAAKSSEISHVAAGEKIFAGKKLRQLPRRHRPGEGAPRYRAPPK